MVAWYEEGCCIICISLSNVSKGKGKASKTRQDSTAFGSTGVKMG